MADRHSIVTVAGRNKEAAKQANNEPIVITEIALGDGDRYPSGGETALENEVHRGLITGSGTEPATPNTVWFDLYVPPEVNTFYAQEIGLFDEDGILYALSRYAEAIPKFGPDSSSLSDNTFRILVTFSDTENLNVSVSPVAGLTAETLPQHLPFASDSEFASTDTTGKIAEVKQIQNLLKAYLPHRIIGNSVDHDEVLYPVGAGGFLAGDTAGALEIALPEITDDTTALFGSVRVDDRKLGTANYDFRLHPSVINASGGDALVPVMTSNNAPTPIVISASLVDGANSPWKAFDGDDNSFWQTSTASGEQWLQIDHGAGNDKQVDKIELVSSSNAFGPYDFKFQGSNDGTTWTDLLVIVGRTLTTGAETYQLTDTSTAYRYHRLSSDNYTDVLRVHSLQFFDVVIPASEQAGSWSAISVTGDNPNFVEKFTLSQDDVTDRWFITIGELTQARNQASFALTSLRVGSEAAEWFEGWGQAIVQALSGATISEVQAASGQQGFYAVSAGTQTIPANTPTTVQDWTVSADQNTLGDAIFANGELTINANSAGVWAFSCAVDSNTGVAYNDVRIMQNDAIITLQSNAGAGSDTSPNASCAFIKLVAGDVIKVVRYSEGGSSTLVVANCHFAGQRTS